MLAGKEQGLNTCMLSDSSATCVKLGYAVLFVCPHVLQEPKALPPAVTKHKHPLSSPDTRVSRIQPDSSF